MKRLKVNAQHQLARWGAIEVGFCGDRFLPLPVDRTLELKFEFGADWDGTIDLDLEKLAGSRVKPVVFVVEEAVERFDRDSLKLRILHAGAVYCRAPLVHVIRRTVKRDERHAVEVPLEESIRIFAEETNPADADKKVTFAAEVAREADGGEKE